MVQKGEQVRLYLYIARQLYYLALYRWMISYMPNWDPLCDSLRICIERMFRMAVQKVTENESFALAT